MQPQEAGGLFCFCSGLPRLFLSLEITSRLIESTDFEYKCPLNAIYCSVFWENNEKCSLQIATVYFRATHSDII